MQLTAFLGSAFLGAMSVLIALHGNAIAQTSPPIAFDTQLNPATGERSVEQVILERDGIIRTYRLEQMVRPVVEAYAQAPAQIQVGFGNPAPANMPTGLQQDTGATLPPTPTGSERIGVLTDEFTNSALLNIAEDIPGLLLRFPESLANFPGPDLIFAELGLPKGGQSNGCAGVPAPGADSLTVSVPDGQSVTFEGEVFGDFGPAGVIANHGSTRLTEEGVRLASLENLEQGDFEPRAAVAYFRTWVTAIDLSDLGVPEGESISLIELRSASVPTETEVGPRNCWIIDPAFVMGLPAE